MEKQQPKITVKLTEHELTLLLDCARTGLREGLLTKREERMVAALLTRLSLEQSGRWF